LLATPLAVVSSVKRVSLCSSLSPLAATLGSPPPPPPPPPLIQPHSWQVAQPTARLRLMHRLRSSASRAGRASTRCRQAQTPQPREAFPLSPCSLPSPRPSPRLPPSVLLRPCLRSPPSLHLLRGSACRDGTRPRRLACHRRAPHRSSRRAIPA
jgi:hypothetical protein